MASREARSLNNSIECNNGGLKPERIPQAVRLIGDYTEQVTRLNQILVEKGDSLSSRGRKIREDYRDHLSERIISFDNLIFEASPKKK